MSFIYRVTTSSIELAVSSAVCLRDPNSSEATVGISELFWVCVLRCDVFELFGVAVQDEQALNCCGSLSQAWSLCIIWGRWSLPSALGL